METNDSNHVHVDATPGREAVDRFIGAMQAKTRKGSPKDPKLDVRRPNDRKNRRAIARADHAPTVAGRPHARLGRAKLAAPIKGPKQLALEEMAATRAYLSKIPVTALASEFPDIKYVAGVPGIRDVWQLAQARTETIHGIAGLGPVRRKKLRAYLTSKNVPVVWAA